MYDFNFKMVSIKKNICQSGFDQQFSTVGCIPSLSCFPGKVYLLSHSAASLWKDAGDYLHVSLLCTKHFTIKLHEITRSGRPYK